MSGRVIALFLVALASTSTTAVAAPEWQEPVEVATGGISTPIVAASSGGVAAGWTEVGYGNCNDYDRHGCQRARVAVRRADGSFFPPVTLNAPHAGHASMLRLAVTADGDVLAAWHQPDIVYWPEEHSSAYYVAVGSARTGRFTSARKAGPYTWSGLEPLMLVTNRRGGAALAWPDRTSSGVGRLRVMLRPPDGEWSRPVTVAKPAIMHPPGLALADDGRLLLMWADRTRRRGDVAVWARVRAPGGDLSPSDHLHTARMEVNSAWANDLTPAWTPGGERLAFWRSGTTSCPNDCGGTITAYAAWARAGRFSRPQRLSSSPAGLRLVVDAGGRATAAWVEYADNPSEKEHRTEVRLAQRAPGGGAFSDAMAVAPGGSGPKLAALGRDLFLSWYATNEDPATELLGAFRPDDPRRTVTRRIAAPTSVWESDVASTPARELVAAWLEHGEGGTRLLLVSAPDGSTQPVVRRLTASRRAVARSRQGLTFRFRLSEPVEVDLRLRRLGTPRAQLTRVRWFEAGDRRLHVPAYRMAALRAGRYRATMRVTDRADDRGRSRTIRFRVVAAD